MLNIDYRIDMPIYEQVCSGLENLIKCGVLKPKEKIPSVRELAASLSINPNTVQKAIVLMESKGLIYSVKGKGSFVVEEIDNIKEAEFNKNIEEIRQKIIAIKAMGFNKGEIKASVIKVMQEEGMT